MKNHVYKIIQAGYNTIKNGVNREEERERRIKRALNPQKMGFRHYLKLILILAVTLALTRYAQNGRNYSSDKSIHLEVITAEKSSIIKIFRRIGRKIPYSVAILFSGNINKKILENIPRNSTILFPVDNLPLQEELQKINFQKNNLQIITDNFIEMKEAIPVSRYNENGITITPLMQDKYSSGLLVRVSGASIAVITNISKTLAALKSNQKPSIDILIIKKTDNPEIIQLLRPRKTIFVSGDDKSNITEIRPGRYSS